MVSSSSRVLHHLQGQIVLWDRFILQLGRFQRHYTWLYFYSLGSASSEPSPVGIILLRGEPLLSPFLSFFSFGCILTWGGHDYLIHSCILSSLFWGRFFPCGFFPLSPLYKRCAFAFCTWVPNMA